ncbi:hypothetical protein GGQ99_001309 [Aminobacter niigataensis]|uniref:Phospholipase C/D domain-containing protein n=1 Tax=Aminobacter niigataensis TaxID=83265 RepID=A0ABR6KYN1_9HYPH|nr:zinc dependent phospholipase C family protein [Aminobacter niigataensis]MBB4649587.1 hypothetical protein [Aminobacter niigataensis]
MPKFGSHIIFAELAHSKRPDLFPDHHENAYRFGSIGPDTTLFMFDPAIKKPELRKGMAAVLEILSVINRTKEDIKKITDELTKPVDDIADWLTGGLSTDLRYTVNTVIDAFFLTVKLGIALAPNAISIKNPLLDIVAKLPAGFIKNPEYLSRDWVVQSTDTVGFPFRMFGHPYTNDPPWKDRLPPGLYDEWWWMDILHYRRSGAFASSLLANARGPVQTSYAKGYLTHYAGDICGHPFINSLVEGPFRNHAYRHLVLETISDTWLWNNVKRRDILKSRLDKLIYLNTVDSEQVAELVVRCMREVYTPPMVPSLLEGGYPSTDDFLFAYRFMRNYLRMSTDGTVGRPKAPPGNANEVIEELKDLLRRNDPGPLPGWNGNIMDFLSALFNWIGKGLTLLLMIATLPWAVLFRFVAAVPRWIIYIINLALFYIVSAMRTMLCLTGWGYCSNEDFKNFGFLKDMIVSRGYEGNQYPLATSTHVKPPFYWLVPPRWIGSLHEPDATIPMNPNIGGKRPDWMVAPGNTMNIQAILELGYATTPDEGARIANRYGGSSVFGNAVDFSIALLDGSLPLFDFDLDGDRGSGYKGWEETPPGEYYV